MLNYHLKINIDDHIKLIQKARELYQQAKREGLIKLSNKCVCCGIQDSRIDGHHFDYHYPFLVLPLCPKCHGHFHRNLKNNTFETATDVINKRISDKKEGYKNLPLTEKQKQIYDYLCEIQFNCEPMPTIREIQKELGFNHSSSIEQILQSIEKKRYIKRTKNKSRAIEILK